MGFVITLIILGIILLLAEIFLIPGIGIAGILGLISLCGSSYYAFAFLSPMAGNIVLLAVVLFYALRAKTWKKLELSTVIDNTPSEATLGLGDKGKAVTRLGPMGTARFDGKSYEVTALEGMIDAGQEVEVVHIENNKVYVRAIMPNEAF